MKINSSTISIDSDEWIENTKVQDFIRLNFFPIEPQQFEFQIWRKEYQGEKKEGIYSQLYRNSLPIDEDLEKRKDYWISFERMDNFEEFVCKTQYNNRLTLKYLYFLLLKSITRNLESHDYETDNRRFYQRVYLVLNESRLGKQTIFIEPYFLQITQQFGFIIDFKFRRNQDVLFTREVQQLSLSLDKNFRSNKNFYSDKYQKVKEFFTRFNSKIFPLDENNNNISLIEKPQDLPTESLHIKKFIFHDGEIENSQFNGIKNNGPLKKVDHKVKLFFIFDESDKYLVENLKNALLGNFPGFYFKGLENFFNLEIDDIIFKPIQKLTKSNLNQTFDEILEFKQKNSEFLIMPIFINEKENDNIYYHLKYRSVKEKLPIQVATIELLRNRENLKWSVSNIALQIFSKLGGKPWKVKPSHENSLIFGIGKSHVMEGDKIRKFFAYSVCTDSSGIYKKIDVLGNDSNEDNYLQQLKDNMIQTLREHITEGYDKFVLHIPFKIKTNELEAISESIKDIAKKEADSEIEFVVLRIDPDTKFFGYAYSNSLVPYESTYIQISKNPLSYLVWFEGLQYHRETIYKRTAGPVLIEFYWFSKNDLDKKEITKYLQDVLNLSGANWRGFNAKNLPISIYYCQLIAKFLKNFHDEIDNIEDIPEPWFL